MALVFCLVFAVVEASAWGQNASHPPDAGPVDARPPDAGPPDAGPPDVGPPDAGPPDAESLRPPELLERAEAAYPEAARSKRLEATVVLRLTIDVEGQVTEAEVIETAGNGLDEAARDAALRSRFKPARRGGRAIASRIRFPYVFKLPPEPAPPPTPGTPAGSPDETGVDGGPPVPESGATLAGPEGADGGAEPSVRRAMSDPAAPDLERTPSEADQSSAEETVANVTVHGASIATRRRQSAEAVKVVELQQARRESADLGEVLARSEGVGIRRSGGLGSDARFSLNGLTDDQIRFFIDGVPLEFSGYPLGIANVPVNLIERVEIFAGVVPVRYGADALGGVVDLKTPGDFRGSRVGGSYATGSFGTHRATLGGRHLHQPSGFFSRVDAFWDSARNDYFVDVRVADATGADRPVHVRRFHDAYRAAGAHAELGFVDRPWAQRLLLKGHYTGFDKEIQHNPSMTIPYGGITYGERLAGTSLRFEDKFGASTKLSAVGGYSYRLGNYVDTSSCVWDWLGDCVRTRATPGETDGKAHDQLSSDHSAYVRSELVYRVSQTGTLRLALAPTFFTRTGDERIPDPTKQIDELNSRRSLFGLVSGIEYELDLWGDRLENIAFAKVYLQELDSEEVRAGGVVARDRTTLRPGVGDALRFRLTPWLLVKASYEYATRLPPPEEIFGDNVFIRQNLDLKPEKSHNGNLGLLLNARNAPGGEYRGSVNGFLRMVDDFIIRFGNERLMSYQNVYNARVAGVEASAGWTSPGQYLALDGNFTYQDLRNISTGGTFQDYAGDRIPNRPFLFANASARFSFRDLPRQGHVLSLTAYTRYVHEFWLGWQSVGSAASRSVVPTQVVGTLVLTYLFKMAQAPTSVTLEAQNIGDAKVFDYFGVQRPGRAFFGKVTFEY